MKINVESNSKQLRALLTDIANTQLRQAEASALNTTRTHVLKKLRADMESALNVPSKYRKYFRKRFINKRGRASARKLLTNGWVGTFKVSYELLNKKPPGTSFEATMPTGHTGRFQRIRGSQISGRGKMGPTSQKAVARGWKREKIREPKIDISGAVNRRLQRALASKETAKIHDDAFVLGLAKRIRTQAFKRGVEVTQ